LRLLIEWSAEWSARVYNGGDRQHDRIRVGFRRHGIVSRLGAALNRRV
jgi:hypothetical protein